MGEDMQGMLTIAIADAATDDEKDWANNRYREFRGYCNCKEKYPRSMKIKVA